MTQKPRIAWFATKEGGPITYLSHLLLPILRTTFDITHFSQGENDTERYQIAAQIHAHTPFDLFVYHLESHPRSNPARIHLGLIPGVVVFHDFFLSTEGPEPIHSSPWMNIADTFAKGASWPSRAYIYPGRTPRSDREISYAIIPILFREQYRAEFVRTCIPRFSEQVPPMVLNYPVEIGDVIPPQRKIAFCGAPSIESRSHNVLHAVSLMKEATPFYWLIDSSERSAAESLLKEFSLSKVTLVEGRTPAAWSALVKDAAVAVHTSHLSFSSLSPYLEISAAYGAPIIRSAAQEGGLPERFGLIAPPGYQEALTIAKCLDELSHLPLRDDSLIEWARKHLSSLVQGERWTEAFSKALPVSRRFLSAWNSFEQSAKAALFGDAHALLPRDALTERWITQVEASYQKL